MEDYIVCALNGDHSAFASFMTISAALRLSAAVTSSPALAEDAVQII